MLRTEGPDVANLEGKLVGSAGLEARGEHGGDGVPIAAEEGDGYIKSIVSRYVPTYGWMTAQAVSADDIKNIMAYVQNPPDVAPVTDSGSQCPTVDEMALPAEDGDSGIWFLILLVLFLIIALSAAGVNRSLTNAVNKDAGEDLLPELPYGNRIQNWAWKIQL